MTIIIWSSKIYKFMKTIKNNQNPLDFPITHEELTNKLKSQKCRKSCGPDSILGEMLKHSTPALQTAVLKLFNLVLSSGCSPDIWSQGLITPIHKSGDKLDPNNFRGICVSSNLGKLFSSILNNRIVNFLNEHNVLSPSQIGFLPNFRTTDHIHTLHTLINEHVKQTKNGKIFACFIDFKKAFDSIWHDGLYYKFLQSGVGGKVYDIIKSMYSNNKCAIRIGNKHTDFFTQKRGVRQGCSLSPTLFNIYINELAVLLDWSTAPGLTLQDQNIKLLLYADDLVLLSSTPQGLQQHRPAGQLLPELGPGSKPQKDQHYGLSEQAQMSGTQIPVQSRQHRTRTHDAVHLPRPDHHCIGEFQYGSECSQR